MTTLYDDLGKSYSVTRSTDPKIAKQLYYELQGASRIINIGAGTGSYEPENVDLIALEPSWQMISQRRSGSHSVVKGFSETLPFGDSSFSHAMTVLSIHHWADRALAFGEINRVVTEKFVAITWDPDADPFWLTRDYFPEIYEMDKRIFPKMEEFINYFDEVNIYPLQVPGDCKDGFLAAFWKRPAAYLNPEVRGSVSPFSNINKLSEGLQKLKDDLGSGLWAKNNHAILNAEYLDVGYRVISATVRNIHNAVPPNT